MTYIPGLSILIALLIIVLVVFWKLDTKQLSKMLEGKGFLLISTLILFGFLLVLHLFQTQAWTADMLKVIIGVVVGLGASYSSEKKKADAGLGVDARSSQFGDYAKVAGRDINETIERMEAEIGEIRDSVFHQYSTIQQGLASLSNQPASRLDFLVNTVYERGMDRAVASVKSVVNRWSAEGWQLFSVSSDYSGIDGMVLIFTRPSEGRGGRFQFYHGSEMTPTKLP